MAILLRGARVRRSYRPSVKRISIDVLTTPGAPAAITEGLADLATGRVADNEALRARFTPR